MSALAPHVAVYLRERLPVELGASRHTCETYCHALRLCFEFAATRHGVAPSALEIEQLDAATIASFCEHLEQVRGNTPRTRNARLAAIKAFMRFIEYRVPAALDQVRQIRAIPSKLTDQVLVGYLDAPQIKALLDAPDLQLRSGIRDRAMIHLCLAAGLRVSELVTLPLSAVTLHAQPSVHLFGKGRRERALPLYNAVARDLRAWREVREEAGAPECFLNARDGPMTRSGFEYVLRKHVANARASCPSLIGKTVSPHVLRHTCAITVLQATGDVRKVSLWLGHAGLNSTQIYLRADPAEKLSIVEAMIPPPLRKGRFRASDELIRMLTGK
ncbi:MAG: tyrosine-type recombinase/integrase [Chromatiales bacterium]|nr:tyrosine-type recombinase/integrase [Chromatiales bacterium]